MAGQQPCSWAGVTAYLEPVWGREALRKAGQLWHFVGNKQLGSLTDALRSFSRSTGRVQLAACTRLANAHAVVTLLRLAALLNPGDFNPSKPSPGTTFCDVNTYCCVPRLAYVDQFEVARLFSLQCGGSTSHRKQHAELLIPH